MSLPKPRPITCRGCRRGAQQAPRFTEVSVSERRRQPSVMGCDRSTRATCSSSTRHRAGRIDRRRAPCRNPRSEESCHREDTRHAGEHLRVQRRDAEEERLHEPPQDDGETEAEGERRHEEREETEEREEGGTDPSRSAHRIDARSHLDHVHVADLVRDRRHSIPDRTDELEAYGLPPPASGATRPFQPLQSCRGSPTVRAGSRIRPDRRRPSRAFMPSRTTFTGPATSSTA